MSEVKEAEVTNAAPDAAVDVTPAGPYIGGKIVIEADAKNGAISVNAPQNIIIALGLLEVAKSILIAKQQEAIARAQAAAVSPSILRAGPEALRNLRPS